MRGRRMLKEEVSTLRRTGRGVFAIGVTTAIVLSLAVVAGCRLCRFTDRARERG